MIDSARAAGRIRIADLVSPGIAAIRPYEPGRPIDEVERELGIKGVIKLASNENPLGPSPRALEALSQELGKLSLYPDGACYYLRRALAAQLKVEEVEIALGNGSNELLDLLVRAFCTPEHEVLAPSHTFVCYRLAAQMHGVGYREIPRGPDFSYSVDAFLAAVTPRTRILFLANPDNPTGVYLGEAELLRLVRELPPQVILAVDEAYREYVRAPDYADLLARRCERELLVLLRTFSKIYGLAGVRCGYAIAPREVVSYLDRVRNPFNVSMPAQVAARAAIGDTAHVERSQRLNAAGMAQLQAGLERLGVRYIPSQANFLLIDVAPREGQEVFLALLRRAVIVRPLGGYRLPHHLRVTVGTAEENHQFLTELEAVLG
ncbi:MAG TPA: histidinol-phosphate transaminase [Polyangia bacterium]|jgi:histidinol-phosphate aminotransferase|nr:histidinol-phosphate transaminase [Polyangia bacterium]